MRTAPPFMRAARAGVGGITVSGGIADGYGCSGPSSTKTLPIRDSISLRLLASQKATTTPTTSQAIATNGSQLNGATGRG